MKRVAWLLLVSISAAVARSGRAQCIDWTDGFAGSSWLRGSARVATYGGKLHVFGQDVATSAWRFARYDVPTWTVLPALDATVRHAVVFDDGGGPQLYATGEFVGLGPHIARWDGTTWLNMPGLTGTSAYGNVLAVHDDGGGSALFAGGRFTSPGAYVARWRNGAWSALGAGTNGIVRALASYDEGSGPRLFVGGEFTSAGGAPISYIARWDGSSWTAVGSGLPFSVSTLAVHDVGAGPRLFASMVVGGVKAWDGSSWTAAGAEMSGNVSSFAVHDFGSGPRLVASNGFGGFNGAAYFDGVGWTALPGPIQSVASIDSAAGELVLATPYHGTSASGAIETWNGSAYRALGAADGLDFRAHVLKAREIGGTAELYAGGDFWIAGNVICRGIARWDGQRWNALGNGLLGAPLNSGVLALEFFDDGTGGGSRLHAASGAFQSTGTRMAVWDGASWTAVPGTPGPINCLRVFDDGSGPQLYVGGFFTLGASRNIARWNGTAWSGVGTGFNNVVDVLEVFDDGSGPRLYAGGPFNEADGIACVGIARFDGSSWSAVGSGLTQSVRALALHDAGAGPALYAATTFDVHRWDGSTWTSTGSPTGQFVNGLVSHDEGAGRELFAITSLTSSSRLAKWNGTTWIVLPGTIVGTASAIAAYGGPADPNLFVAGDFTRAGTRPSSYIARRSMAGSSAVYCLGDGSGAPCPCGNTSPAADRAGCANSTGDGAALRAQGCSTLASDAVVLSASHLGSGAALFFQGTAAEHLDVGSPFGDGLRCVGGSVVRLASVVPSGGSAELPEAAHPQPISVLGSVPATGGARYYQVWYRNAAAFCTPATWNLSNAVRITWSI